MKRSIYNLKNENRNERACPTRSPVEVGLAEALQFYSYELRKLRLSCTGRPLRSTHVIDRSFPGYPARFFACQFQSVSR
jgi:hypothetical protein